MRDGGTRNRPWAVLLFCGVLLLWCCGVFFAQRAGEYMGLVSVRWTGEGQGVSPASVERAARYAREDGAEGQPTATLWRENKGQSVNDPEGDAASSADVLEGFGDLNDLYPASFLYGGYPAQGDSEGCAIDSALAFRLWGSSEAVGRSIQWNGSTYVIRGVLRGDAGLMFTQGEGDSEVPFDQMLLRFPGMAGADEAGAYLNRNQFPGGTVLDLPLIGWCLGALAALPGLVLAIGLLCRLWARGWKLRYTPILLCQYLPFGLAGAAAAVWAAGFPWDVPDRVIPTRWADFEFWGKLGGQLAEGVRQALSAGLSRRESAMWAAALCCLLLAVCAAALILPLAGRVETCSSGRLLWMSLLGMGAVFAITAALADQGGLTAGRSLWLLPALWLTGDFCLRVHEKTLLPRPVTRELEEETT